MKIVSVSPVAIVAVVAATAAVQAVAVTLDLNTIILAVIGLVGTSVTGFLALRVAALGAESKKIHVAVNSGKTSLENEIKELRRVVTEQMGVIKTLEEKGRGAELAKAIASVPPVVVMPVGQAVPAIAAVPAQATPVMGTWGGAAPAAAKVEASDSHATPLETAIVDLTEAAKDTVEAAGETLDKTAVLKDKVPSTL